MAGSEDAGDSKSYLMSQKQRFGRFTQFAIEQVQLSAKGATTSMVQTWANRHIKDGNQTIIRRYLQITGEMALVSEESVTQNSYQSNKTWMTC
jgi:hypothetical protein